MAKIPLETIISTLLKELNRQIKDADMDKSFDLEMEKETIPVPRGEKPKKRVTLTFSTTEFGEKTVLYSVSYNFKDRKDEVNSTRWKTRLYDQFMFDMIATFGQTLGQLKKMNIEAKKDADAVLVDVDGNKLHT